MNLLLHYLKFDFRRWRLLIAIVWILALLEIGLMVLQGHVITDGDTAFYAAIPARTLWILLGIGHAVLCVLAGGADSPRSASAWLMTRPRYSRALALSRFTVIMGGGVIPLILTWLVSLAVLEFDGATILRELPYYLLTVLCCTAALSFWALGRPFLPGVIIGAAGTTTLFLLVRLLPFVSIPDWFFRRDIDFLSVAAPLAMASLAGLHGLGRRVSKRRNAFTGLATGVTGVTALVVTIPLQAWFLDRGSFDIDYLLREARVHRLQVSPGATVSVSGDRFRSILEIPLAEPDAVRSAFSRPARFASFSWRKDASSPWSPWLEVRSRNTPLEGNGWRLTLECATESLEEMERGEFRVSLVHDATQAVAVSVQQPTVWTGDGWVAKIQAPDSGGEPRLLYVLRSLNQETVGLSISQDTGFRIAGTRTAFVNLPFVRCAWVNQSGARKAGGSAPDKSLPEAILTRQTSPADLYSVVHISGIRYAKPHREAPLRPGSAPLRMQTQPPREPGNSARIFTSFRPWLSGGRPLPPAKDAPVTEAARWLQSIATPVDRTYTTDPVLPAADAAVLAEVVASHTTLVLNFVEEWDFLTPAAVLASLRKNLPDAARHDVIERIPRAPAFALLARDRGWLDEARTAILRTLLQAGGVPANWEPLLRHDRLPDFAVSSPVQGLLSSAGIIPWQQDLNRLAVVLTAPHPDNSAAMEESISRRLRPVLEKARQENEPAFHLALQYSEFLFHGEPEALNALLFTLTEKHGEGPAWHTELARQWVRGPAAVDLPAADEALLQALNKTSADDFQFDPSAHLWLRRSSSAP